VRIASGNDGTHIVEIHQSCRRSMLQRIDANRAGIELGLMSVHRECEGVAR
jgi:hypothetical protein